MTSIMTYQYPPTNGDEIGYPTSNYLQALGVRSHQSALGGPAGGPLDLDDLDEADMMMQNPFPGSHDGQMSGSPPDSQHQSSSQGDKRRNKLGYHRTSIACSEYQECPGMTEMIKHQANVVVLGHCRRRKIRCITSSDVQNKCMNCIRLKKECSFFPVDQQVPQEGRPKAASRSSVSSKNASSATSSPTVSSVNSKDLNTHHSLPHSGMASASGMSRHGGRNCVVDNSMSESNGKLDFPTGIPKRTKLIRR